MSCKDPWEVTKIAIFLSKIYDDVKVQCGKKLQYLGMDLDKVKISFIPYVENIIKDFPKEIREKAGTPAVKDLFKV